MRARSGRVSSRPRSARVRFAVALLGLLAGPAAAASQTLTLEGRWRGEVDVPGTPLAVLVEFSATDAGWQGTIDIPAQGAQGLALSGIRVARDSVSFAIDGVSGDPTFHGILGGEGHTIAGTFTQGAGSFPFSLVGADGAADTAALEGLAPWLAAAMEAWKVPGLAVAVVRDGQVVHLAGYGLRDVEDSLPVTTGTVFALGSASKAFTTALLGTLIDEGRLEWDDPVRAYLPGFALADSAVARRMTVRDLVTHRSGLPRHDLLWYAHPDLTRTELIARLAYLPASADLRQRFQYNNLMFMTAGVLAGRIAGTRWEVALRDRILGPLGMTGTSLTLADLRAASDHALPYAEQGDSLLRIPFRRIDVIGPAGSINSSAEDMVAWLRMQLGEGTLDGREVLRAGTVREMQTPQMVIGARPSGPDIGVQTYGLGWFIDSYRGHFHVHHGGNIDGFSANVTLFPHDRLGIVVLSNLNGTPLPGFVSRWIADRVFGLDPKDWSGVGLIQRAARRAAQADSSAAAAAERVEGTHPSHPLDDYVGTFRHPGYGDLVIERTTDGLQARYGSQEAALEHWHYDVFVARDPTERSVLNKVRLRFSGDLDGSIAGVEWAVEPTLPAAHFSRIPDECMSDPAYLDRLVGIYRLQTQAARVERRGTVLSVTLPGQPTYTLVPERAGTFRLEGLSGYRARFEMGPDGEAVALTFLQPNGTFRFERVEGEAVPETVGPGVHREGDG